MVVQRRGAAAPTTATRIYKGDVRAAVRRPAARRARTSRPTAFRNGIDAAPPDAPTDAPTIQHDRDVRQPRLLDAATTRPGSTTPGIVWWDPNATGPDETGNVGKGMYRMMDGGLRYLPSQWPTTPMALFDPDEHRHDLRRDRGARGVVTGEATVALRRTECAGLSPTANSEASGTALLGSCRFL